MAFTACPRSPRRPELHLTNLACDLAPSVCRADTRKRNGSRRPIPCRQPWTATHHTPQDQKSALLSNEPVDKAATVTFVCARNVCHKVVLSIMTADPGHILGLSAFNCRWHLSVSRLFAFVCLSSLPSVRMCFCPTTSMAKDFSVCLLSVLLLTSQKSFALYGPSITGPKFLAGGSVCPSAAPAPSLGSRESMSSGCNCRRPVLVSSCAWQTRTHEHGRRGT
jgi:hypothetical protein